MRSGGRASRGATIAAGAERVKRAESLLADLFEKAGWRVVPARGREARVDLLVRRKGSLYAVEVKAGPEGRSDRLVPLFAQAALEAKAARGKAVPLAVVAAPRVPQRVAEQVLHFAHEYAPEVAAGVIDFEGAASFRGPGLEGLDARPAETVRAPEARVRDRGQLFSDLNQWMLKVLLSPELPEGMLSAPRGEYRNASELARAAGVSLMSASRFARRFEREGFLEASGSHLRLVRRGRLSRRWQSFAAQGPAREAALRFLLPGDRAARLRQAFRHREVCLALFSAADALGVGVVHGVPAHVYVPRIDASELRAWRGVRACAPGESPDLIVRQPQAPQSVFRGAVPSAGDMKACDVLQVWLDVESHPSRGREQANLIEDRVLGRLFDGGA